MLTNNFRTLLAGTLCNVTPTNYKNSLTDAITEIAPTMGGYVQFNSLFSYFNNYSNFINYSYTENREGVVIYTGGGNTLPTESDYKLENPYTDVQMISLTGSTYNSTLYTVELYKTYTATLENKASVNRTISEVGLLIGLPSTSNDKVKLLMAREILDTPITLEPGATKTFTFRIDF